MTKDDFREVARIGRRELAGAVHKAVGLAASRHKLDLQANLFDRDDFRLPPFINGRRCRDIDMDQAFKAAETIVENLGLKDVAVQTVALKIDKDILVGFIERFQDQFEFQDMFQPGGGNY